MLDWSPTTHPEFHHYTALRSPEREISPRYPPVAPAVDWGDTYTTDRFVTSAVDASIIPSETRWFYRVMAYDSRNRVVAASSVRGARLRAPTGLGQLEVGAGPDGVTRLSWRTYDGEDRCFSAYRVLAGSGGGALDTLAIESDQVDRQPRDRCAPLRHDVPARGPGGAHHHPWQLRPRRDRCRELHRPLTGGIAPPRVRPPQRPAANER